MRIVLKLDKVAMFYMISDEGSIVVCMCVHGCGSSSANQRQVLHNNKRQSYLHTNCTFEKISTCIMLLAEGKVCLYVCLSDCPSVRLSLRLWRDGLT